MFYVDTSIWVASIVAESKSRQVHAWMSENAEQGLVLSDWTRTEFSSALALKLRRGDIDSGVRDAALEVFSTVVENSFRLLEVERNDFILATRFANHEDIGLRSGDALHAAIAFNRGLTLCTLDKGFAKSKVLGLKLLLIA